MDVSIPIALLGQNSIVRNGLGHILAARQFEIRQSVDHVSHLVGDCADHELMVIVDSDIDRGDTGEIALLHRRFPAVKLVVLSEQFDFDAMIRAFAAGVHGYLVKEISVEPLTRSLRLIASGEKVMPSRLVEELALRAVHAPREQARRALEQAHLSIREVQILNCLALGYPNKIISRRLAITEATVKVHVKAVLRKLHVRNRTQAAILGINGSADDSTDGGLLDPDDHSRGAGPLLHAA